MKRKLGCVALGAVLLSGGVAHADSRIVGGQDATIAAFPSTVSIGAKGADSEFAAHYCGGTLIYAQWVLTAAHCFDNDAGTRAGDPATVQVLAGVTSLSQTDNARATAVSELIVHEGYPGSGPSGPGGPNDLALLKLAAPITSSPTTPLAQGSDDALHAAGARLTVAGWGSTNPDSKAPGAFTPQFKRLDIQARADADCGDGFASALELCTSLLPGTPLPASSCQGDSGGPLYASTQNGLVLVGVVSRGPSPCNGANDDEGIYGEVRAFRSWIEGKTGAPLPGAPSPVPTPAPAPTPAPVLPAAAQPAPGSPPAPSQPTRSASTRPTVDRAYGVRVSRSGRLRIRLRCATTPCVATVAIKLGTPAQASRRVTLRQSTQVVSLTARRRTALRVGRKLRVGVTVAGTTRTVTLRVA